MPIKVTLKPHLVGKMLLWLAIIIALLSIVTEYIVEVVLANETGTLRILVLDLFSVNLEESIPTWYSVLILFAAALLLMLIAIGKYRVQDKYRHYWTGLAILFLYLSMDEGAAIHEIAADPLQQAFNTSGFLAFGWQIAAFPLVILVVLIYWRFVFHLPPFTRNLFMLSGVVYAGGALIVEGLSAAIWEVDGISITYLAVATLEELLEILGVSLLIFTLCDYYVKQGYLVQLLPVPEASAPDPRPPAESLPEQGQVNKPRFLLFASAIIGLLVIANVAAFIWQVGDEPIVTEAITLPFYYPIQSELDESNVLVLEVPEVFSINSGLSRQIAYDLLANYEEVTVVVLPALSSSFLFAGDSLPLDQQLITELLHDNGYIEFVIYETDAVTLFTANLASP